MSQVFDAAEECPLTWSVAITYKMGHSPTPALSHPRVQLMILVSTMVCKVHQSKVAVSAALLISTFFSLKLTVVQKHIARVCDVHLNNQRE
jgi:hypothetical protein